MRTKTLVVMLVLALCPRIGAAQSSQDNWDNLRQLRPGQKIEVIDPAMKSFRGAFVSVSEEAITLEAGKGQESILRPNVVRVSVRDTSHRTRNMLLGSGILGGAALALAIPFAVVNSNEGSGCGACIAAIAAGFGGGAALGALPGNRTVYRVKK